MGRSIARKHAWLKLIVISGGGDSCHRNHSGVCPSDAHLLSATQLKAKISPAERFDMHYKVGFTAVAGIDPCGSDGLLCSAWGMVRESGSPAVSLLLLIIIVLIGCICLNLSKSNQSTAGLKALKPAANRHYLIIIMIIIIIIIMTIIITTIIIIIIIIIIVIIINNFKAHLDASASS